MAREHLSIEGTVTAKARTNVWKPVFYGTTAVAAAAAGIAIYEWQQQVQHSRDSMSGLSDNDCGKSSFQNLSADSIQLFKDACKAHDRWKISTIVGIGVGLWGATRRRRDPAGAPEAR